MKPPVEWLDHWTSEKDQHRVRVVDLHEGRVRWEGVSLPTFGSCSIRAFVRRRRLACRSASKVVQ
ncbi:MAG: hypothetical protein U0441_14850 [Polyangiaceae bacterium]